MYKNAPYASNSIFIETAQTCLNSTLSSVGIGWNVTTHLNWFDKKVHITKLKGKLPPMFGRKMKNLRMAQESVWINKTLATFFLDSDNDNACVYSMICDVKQALEKNKSLSVGQYKVFFQQT